MAWGPKRPQGPHPLATAAAITELARLEKWAFRPRHKKTDFYEYLDGVLNLFEVERPKLCWKGSKGSARGDVPGQSEDSQGYTYHSLHN